MIKIKLSPINKIGKTQCSIEGTIITVDGEVTDLSTLPDGATASTEKLRDVTRTGDDYELTIILAHGVNAPYETRFPEPVEVTSEVFNLGYHYDGREAKESV